MCLSTGVLWVEIQELYGQRTRSSSTTPQTAIEGHLIFTHNQIRKRFRDDGESEGNKAVCLEKWDWTRETNVMLLFASGKTDELYVLHLIESKPTVFPTSADTTNENVNAVMTKELEAALCLKKDISDCSFALHVPEHTSILQVSEAEQQSVVNVGSSFVVLL